MDALKKFMSENDREIQILIVEMGNNIEMLVKEILNNGTEEQMR